MSAGITFLMVRHDEVCPGRYADGEGCTCRPEYVLHNDVQRFIDCEMHNRATRRKAAREAERATRKARGATR